MYRGKCCSFLSSFLLNLCSFLPSKRHTGQRSSTIPLVLFFCVTLPSIRWHRPSWKSPHCVSWGLRTDFWRRTSSWTFGGAFASPQSIHIQGITCINYCAPILQSNPISFHNAHCIISHHSGHLFSVYLMRFIYSSGMQITAFFFTE